MAVRPLRVLHIASTSEMGGAEQMTMQFIRYADPGRVTPEVLSIMGPGHLTLLAMQAGVAASNWALKSLANPCLLRRMGKFLRAGRYDIVHCYGLRAELLTRWPASRLGIPVISGVHSIDPWRKRPHVWLDRMTAGAVTAWVAVAEAVKQSRVKREHFPADRIHVVYNGIPDAPPPTGDDKRGARERLGIDQAAPVLAMIANVREAKGYPDLIEAMVQLREKHPNIVCLCAGRDDSGGEIPKLAEARGVGGAMRWLGFVNDPGEILAAADVAVLSSHWEGCPINILESMRAARATVSTNVGGIPELIENDREGLLVDPKKPADLAAAIDRVLCDPLLRENLAQSAREKFAAKFTISTMVEELTKLYERYGRSGL
ncbi:glycosyltransferase family 4 protein [bacterium]|nr:glycosyltransferase family 4 protein [bacterium]